MRPDMAKVIVERPRRGGGVRFPRGSALAFSRLDADDVPRRQGMRRPWLNTSRQKHLNENLAPLRRFLLSNVNRPWNKLFSEISQHLRLDSAVQLHVWQHLKWEVCLQGIRRGKRYVDARGDWIFQPFVVDVRTGLLRKNEASWHWGWRRHDSPRREKIAPSDFIAVDAQRCFRRIDAIWYGIELAPLPGDVSGLFDAVLKRRLSEVRHEDLILLHCGPVYAVRKRQLNSKEIRRLVS